MTETHERAGAPQPHAPKAPNPAMLERGVVLIENFASPEACQALSDHARSSSASSVPAEIGTSDGEALISPHRVCSVVHPGPLEGLAESLLDRVFLEIAPAHFPEPALWYERCQILLYTPGGHFKQHADSETFDRATERWVRRVDRDLSAIIYLNDEFEGGELIFTDLLLKVRPKKGMLLLFPADHRFSHLAKPTLTGHRIALVSWAACASSGPREGAAPEGKIRKLT